MDLLTETLLITLVAAIGFAHDGLGSNLKIKFIKTRS